MHFTDSEVGLYARLLCVQWSTGSLPDDDAELLCYGKGTTPLVRVKAKFAKGADGRLRNLRMETEREKQIAFRQRQSEHGRLGGRPTRKAKPKPSLSQALPEPNPSQTPPSPSPSPSPVSEFPDSGSAQSGGRSVYPALAEWIAASKQLHPDWPETDATSAWHYYEARGWKSGKSAIRNWRSCIGTCYGNFTKPTNGIRGQVAAPTAEDHKRDPWPNSA